VAKLHKMAMVCCDKLPKEMRFVVLGTCYRDTKICEHRAGFRSNIVFNV
jgi:hypothetical protein